MTSLRTFLLLLNLACAVLGFQTGSFVRQSRVKLFSNSGKGFGAPPPEKKKVVVDSSDEVQAKEAVVEVPKKTGGQLALEAMRRQRAEQRDAELRKVKQIREIDQQVQDTPAAIPEKVAMRMGQRMLPFVGLPLLGILGAFTTFWYLATYKNFEFEPVAVAATTIGLLVAGLLGITFSIFSTSWDEDREGGFFGVEEVSKNLNNVREGLSRSRENALTREKMATMSEDEIQQALSDLDKRDSARNN